ncbi:MFS polyamine transporter [Guyanagaster necrorhizus]|uniref:MFS polyamine transporter n=1 Tax=Guyanagaster necrorhizus TaxID=856835 RepID=A0A9P7VJB3_9AGAR|nr:MFS polyamine transporter [Guyanagaster necrorhizus MCA 3950]KAG7441537.1 MFS polyamine transporter [Guyanagaster necrorhizus MCA 3950]
MNDTITNDTQHEQGQDSDARSGTIHVDASEEEDLVIDWNGPDDPENPKNWEFSKRWRATVIVSLFTFISPVSSSMVSPAMEQVAQDLGISSSVELAMTVSVFVLAYGELAFFLGPLSEIYGRSKVIQFSNVFFFVWNLGCGFAQTKTQLIIFRFFAGLGGSTPLAVGAGVLADMWRAEERGKAIAVYSLAPLMGPVIGPVAGAWIAEKSTWRWVFYSTCIFDVFVQCLGLVFLRESFAPVLLERKAEKIRKSKDPEKGQRNVRTVFDKAGTRSWQQIFATALVRPFALFVREPIVQIVALYMAFIYGVFYLYLTTMPTIFREVYHQNTGIAGLHYIALGLGVSLASQTNARYMDRVYKYLKERNGGVGEPEFRVPSMVPGSIVFPIGLLLTGWCAQKGVHWIATDIGIAFVGAGMILNFQSMQTYVVDTFTLYAASGLAAVSCLRSLAGFGFPLFATSMYDKLGYGKGDTILAVVAIVLGCPAPFLFWKYGKAVRMKSRYTKKPTS